MVDIFSISFMKIVLSVLGGLYTIITETFLIEFMLDLSISSMILLKIEFNLIFFLQVYIKLLATKRDTPLPAPFDLILYLWEYPLIKWHSTLCHFNQVSVFSIIGKV